MQIKGQLKQVEELTKKLNEVATLANDCYYGCCDLRDAEDVIASHNANLTICEEKIKHTKDLIERMENTVLALETELNVTRFYELKKKYDLTQKKNTLETAIGALSKYLEEYELHQEAHLTTISTVKARISNIAPNVKYLYMAHAKKYRQIVRELNDITGLSLPLPTGIVHLEEYTLTDILKKIKKENQKESSAGDTNGNGENEDCGDEGTYLILS